MRESFEKVRRDLYPLSRIASTKTVVGPSIVIAREKIEERRFCSACLLIGSALTNIKANAPEIVDDLRAIAARLDDLLIAEREGL